MATLNVRREYADGDILLESDLDAFLDDIETFLNVTKIDDDNIQDLGITGSTKLKNASKEALQRAQFFSEIRFAQSIIELYQKLINNYNSKIPS